MIHSHKEKIESVEDLVSHLNDVFSIQATAQTTILDVFGWDFLPQIADHLKNSSGLTFDPEQVEYGTHIADLYYLLQRSL